MHCLMQRNAHAIHLRIPRLRAIYPFNASSSFSLKYAIQKFKELHGALHMVHCIWCIAYGAYALIHGNKQRMIFDRRLYKMLSVFYNSIIGYPQLFSCFFSISKDLAVKGYIQGSAKKLNVSSAVDF